MACAEPLQFMDRGPVTHEKDSHVADHFARRSYLHNVAERHVDFCVSASDLRPFVPEAHRFCLFLQIGVLPAGHFVEINFGGAGLWAAVKRSVVVANSLPIIGASIQAVEIQTGLALRVGQRGHQRIEIGLACSPAHRCDRRIGHVHSGFAGL